LQHMRISSDLWMRSYARWQLHAWRLPAKRDS
jgi:hypothetical protein